MTAIEVIDQIKALPPGERAKVVGFIHEMESAKPERTMDRKTLRAVGHLGLRPAR